MRPAATERVRVPLSPPQSVDGTTAVLVHPEAAPAAVFALAHGAGTDLGHPFQRAVAEGLAGRGHAVLLFNFAYTEAGRRRPDPMGRLESAYRDVAGAARDRWPGRPLVLGGRSMGGRVASHLAAEGEPCGGLVFLGYPLHPAGRPERLRTDHWPSLAVPSLFVTGDRDRLCDLDLLARERRRLVAPHRLHVVAGADHGFNVRASDGRTRAEVIDEVVGAVAAWASATLPAETSA